MVLVKYTIPKNDDKNKTLKYKVIQEKKQSEWTVSHKKIIVMEFAYNEVFICPQEYAMASKFMLL